VQPGYVIPVGDFKSMDKERIRMRRIWAAAGLAALARHRRWSLDGTWEKILGRLRAGCDEAEGEPLNAASGGRYDLTSSAVEIIA
jgi:hypothetical protein